MAFIKRVGCLGSNHFCKLPAGNFSPSSLASRFHYRELSKLVKSNGNPVDTLALVRGLEAEGVPSKQAEAVTAAITQILKHSMENASQSFVSKAEMEKIVMIQESNLSNLRLEVESSQKQSEMIRESNLSKFKSEVQSSQVRGLEAEGVPSKQAEAVTDAITSLENASQPFVSKAEMQKLREHQLGTEKLRSDIEKMSRELRYEINNLTKLRLDLNRESRRICDELANQHAEKTNLMNKLDRDIHAIGAQWEAAKYVVRTYCIGTVVLLYAVAFVVICI